MQASDFKKITYALAIIFVLITAYLAFVRKLPGGDSPSLRNAKFLGLKTISVQNNISNQKDLSIDGESNTESTPAKESNTSKVAEPSGDVRNGFYTVKEGDTYGCIAEKYYGSYEHWPDILNANANYGNGFAEYGLHVGAVLEMPAISSSNLKPKSNLCS